MTIILDNFSLPEKGAVDLTVQRSFEINVTAEEARRKVRRWLREEVSMHLDAEPPALVIGAQVVWRVPVVFTTGGVGRVGVVGVIDVDVAAGAMTTTSERKAAIEQQTEALADRLPPYQPPAPVPNKYRPAHIPPAPQVVFDEDDLPVVVPTQTHPVD